MSECQDNKSIFPADLWKALMNLPALRYMKAPVDTVAQLYDKYPIGNEKGTFAFVHDENTFYTYHQGTHKWLPTTADLSSLFDLEFVLNGDVLVWSSKENKFVVSSMQGLKYKKPVDTPEDLKIKYPHPQVGWASLVKYDPDVTNYPNGQIYVWDGVEWNPTGLTGFPKDTVTNSSLTQTLGTATDKAPSEKAVADAFRSSTLLASESANGLMSAEHVKQLNGVIVDSVTKSSITQILGTEPDKVPSGKAVSNALRSADFLASENVNGLMSAEQVKQLNEIIENMKPIEDKYKTYIVISFDNNAKGDTPTICGLFAEGDLDYMVKTKDYKMRDTQYIRGFLKIRPTLLSNNDITTIYANGTKRIELWAGVNAVVYSSDPAFTYFASTYTYFNTLNLNKAKFFTTITVTGSKVKILLINDLSNLEYLSVGDCQNLTSLSIGSTVVRSLNAGGATQLNSMSFPASFTQLESVNIAGTILAKDVVVNLGYSWQSRSGLNTGVLTLNEALFNELSTAEKSLFINKNITFNIA